MSEPGSDGKRSVLEEENRRLREEVVTFRQFIDSMQNVLEAMDAPQQSHEIMELLSEILRNARRTINTKDGSLLVLDEDSGELVFVICQGEIPQKHLHWRRLPAGAGIAGWVVQHRRAAIVNDPMNDDRFYDALDQEFEFSTRSILAVPIIGGGRVLGVLEVLNKRGGMLFSTGDQTLLTLLCRFAGELLYTLVSSEDTVGGTGIDSTPA